MHAESAIAPKPAQGFSKNFWMFWLGQSITNVGSAFTTFALPLLIYKLTNSALNLALANALTFLPYLLFGLIIGAWVDRTNRRRLMIVTDVARGILIGSIALLAALDALPIWLIYVHIFIVSTLGIGYTAAQLAAIPNLVDSDNVIKANGWIQTSYSASLVIGPTLAAVLTAVMPVHTLLFFDALTFVISGVLLVLIRTSFDAPARPKTNLREDILEGLRYVLGHPILRPLTVLTALLVFIDITVNSQLVLFAKHHFQASDSAVGAIYTAGGAGFLIASLSVGFIRKNLSFSTVVLVAAVLKGVFILLMGINSSYWFFLFLWAFSEGVTMLYTINSLSLRQMIVPGQMLGRVLSLAGVLAWSAIPLGTFLGGFAIEQSGNVSLIYTAIGVIHLLAAIPFCFSRLRRADNFLPPEVAVAKSGTAA